LDFFECDAAQEVKETVIDVEVCFSYPVFPDESGGAELIQIFRGRDTGHAQFSHDEFNFCVGVPEKVIE